jgi:cysteine desulfurase/selenocysteine lyase
MNAPFNVDRLRADFPILQQPYAYLDNAASTQHPRQVIEAMSGLYSHDYANVHRGIYRWSEASTEKYEAARTAVRRFINAASENEIIFTAGCTAAINLVARSWGDANLRAGDEILVTEMEHHANLVPWHQLATRTGCVVRCLPITDEGLLRLDLLPQYLTARTKLVAVTALSNVLGTINPVREIIAQAQAVGAKTLIDAAQSAPHGVTDVQALGCDFLAFSGHKMLGPTGVGVLYGREALLEEMPPFLGGGGMISEVTTTGFKPADLPAKFEAGTPPIAEVIGLGAAVAYLESVGLANIHAYEQSLTQLAHERLSAIEGLRLIGPGPEQKGGIVSFTLTGIHSHDIAQVLDQQSVAVRAGHHCTMPLHTRLQINSSTRASFYFYNTPAEVEQLATALLAVKRKFKK